jgi:hypothetical protein
VTIGDLSDAEKATLATLLRRVVLTAREDSCAR